MTSGSHKTMCTLLDLLTVYSDREKSMVAPLLFPCGNLAQETLPLKLEGVGLRVNRIVCYNTTRDSSIEQSLHILKQQGVSTFLLLSFCILPINSLSGGNEAYLINLCRS